jgi:hypothetical protein
MRPEMAFNEDFNPPATPRDICAAEAELGVALPEEIKRLYSEFNGISEYKCISLPFHVMPLSEVVALARAFRGAIFKKYSLVCFWGDDQSNHAGMFLAGPLRGMICFVDHEGCYVGDFSPLFRNLDSFTKRLIELAERNHFISEFEEGRLTKSALKKEVNRFPYQYYDDHEEAYWHAMPVDYPVSSGVFGEEDQIACQTVECLLKNNQFTEEREREFLVFCLARLTPPREVESLLPFLQEDHMYIPRHVCNSLFLRGYDEAIPQIARLAVSGNHNCRQSAEMTLAKFVVAGFKGALEQAYTSYESLGGDTASLRRIIKTLQESPKLMYQW